MWQDLVLTVASLSFMLALVPALVDTEKPPQKTSLTTALTLYVIAATDLTLNLWFTAGTTAITATLWMWLWADRRALDNRFKV